MKFDNIVFSSSEYFIPFWNIQSKIWRTKFGVNPVCLFYGKKKDHNVSEEFGKVIECEYIPDYPQILQIQFSKFFHPTKFPDQTWFIGDIDQIPLRTDYILDGLSQIPDDAYCHFNYSLCAQLIGKENDAFLKSGSYLNGGADLPAHNHLAKGQLYNMFFPGKTLESTLDLIVNSQKYGMIKGCPIPSIQGQYWVAEEMYTSEVLWDQIKNHGLSFYGKQYRAFEDKIDRVGRMGNQFDGKNYTQYDVNRLKNGKYMDIHCFRPYAQQEKSMLEVLKIAGMI